MCMDTSRVAPHAISREVARRYLLGRQGLWPGRRWAGKDGAAEAVRQLEAVQVDPMTVVARSHDLVLWSRVAGYDPEHLDTLLYRDRAFFDYGGCVHIYPVHELPYWRLHMERRRADKRQTAFLAEHAALLDEIREEVRARGPLGNRDFAGHARVSSYRARKDTGLALYHLWLTGELMTHSREGFQRKFDLRDRVASPSVGHVVPAEEAERFFARKALALLGLHTARAWAGTFAFLLNRRIDRAEARRWLEGLVAAGEAASVAVEGQKELYYYPAADAPLLAKLADGDAPVEWRPLDTATREEVILLSHSTTSSRASGRACSSASSTSGKCTSPPPTAAGGTTPCPSSGAIGWWHVWTPNSTAGRGRWWSTDSGWKRRRRRKTPPSPPRSRTASAASPTSWRRVRSISPPFIRSRCASTSGPRLPCSRGSGPAVPEGAVTGGVRRGW